ncbi:MAG TPA: hypothetical protein VGF01_00840, partial [Terracidiphilus sp.]
MPGRTAQDSDTSVLGRVLASPKRIHPHKNRFLLFADAPEGLAHRPRTSARLLDTHPQPVPR